MKTWPGVYNTYVENWFSARDDFNSSGTLGNVWRHFGLSQLDEKCIEAKDISKHPESTFFFFFKKNGVETWAWSLLNAVS